jgi:hypothetical protein
METDGQMWTCACFQICDIRRFVSKPGWFHVRDR